MLVLVGVCISCEATAWFESALSFFAASRQVLVTSVRNIFLDSAEADINVATSVTYLGTAYEWADVVATSEFPCGVFGIGPCPSSMKVFVLGDGLDAIDLWYGCN